MSPAGTSGGLGTGPGEGEALWFNGGLGVLRATADQTDGRYTVMELLAPNGLRVSAAHPSKRGRALRGALRRGPRATWRGRGRSGGRVGRVRAPRRRARVSRRFGG